MLFIDLLDRECTYCEDAYLEFHSGHADKKVHGTRNINALPNGSLDTKSPAQCNDLDALLGEGINGRNQDRVCDSTNRVIFKR